MKKRLFLIFIIILIAIILFISVTAVLFYTKPSLFEIEQDCYFAVTYDELLKIFDSGTVLIPDKECFGSDTVVHVVTVKPVKEKRLVHTASDNLESFSVHDNKYSFHATREEDVFFSADINFYTDEYYYKELYLFNKTEVYITVKEFKDVIGIDENNHFFYSEGEYEIRADFADNGYVYSISLVTDCTGKGNKFKIEDLNGNIAKIKSIIDNMKFSD